MLDLKSYSSRRVGNLALWVPKFQEPLEGYMIRSDGEMTAIQVRMKVLYRFYCGQ